MLKKLLPSLCVVALLSAMATMPRTTEGQDLNVPIVVSPNVLNLDSQGVWVTVHAEIPYGLVAKASITLDSVPVNWTKADSRGELVAKFCFDDVKPIVKPGTVTLTLSGVTIDEVPFSGSDTIKVIAGSKK